MCQLSGEPAYSAAYPLRQSLAGAGAPEIGFEWIDGRGDAIENTKDSCDVQKSLQPDRGLSGFQAAQCAT